MAVASQGAPHGFGPKLSGVEAKEIIHVGEWLTIDNDYDIEAIEGIRAIGFIADTEMDAYGLAMEGYSESKADGILKADSPHSPFAWPHFHYYSHSNRIGANTKFDYIHIWYAPTR